MNGLYRTDTANWWQSARNVSEEIDLFAVELSDGGFD
jgi:hypothetical protein